jgi:hypothetical protein
MLCPLQPQKQSVRFVLVSMFTRSLPRSVSNKADCSITLNLLSNYFCPQGPFQVFPKAVLAASALSKVSSAAGSDEHSPGFLRHLLDGRADLGKARELQTACIGGSVIAKGLPAIDGVTSDAEWAGASTFLMCEAGDCATKEQFGELKVLYNCALEKMYFRAMLLPQYFDDTDPPADQTIDPSVSQTWIKIDGISGNAADGSNCGFLELIPHPTIQGAYIGFEATPFTPSTWPPAACYKVRAHFNLNSGGGRTVSNSQEIISSAFVHLHAWRNLHPHRLKVQAAVQAIPHHLVQRSSRRHRLHPHRP